MLSNRLRRSLPVLFLLAGLILPLTQASAVPLPTSPTHQSSMGSAIWVWLTHLFQATWAKNGMTIDPDGKPTAAVPSEPQMPNGPMPDPRS